jgi:chromosome segregation ATPase
MDIVSLVVGLGVGAVAAIGAIMSSKGKLAELQGRLDKVKADKDKKDKALKEAEGKLKSLEGKKGELEKNLDKTKKSLKRVESEKEKAEREAKEKEQALKETEGKAANLAAKAEEAEGKIKQSQQELSKIKEDAEAKAQEVSNLKEEMKKAGVAAVASYDQVKGDLNGILKVLCEHESQAAAVLADANGIIVASHGSKDVSEGVAAAARRITKISASLQGMVEFSQVSSFRLADSSNHVIAGRAFDLEGELVALATVGDNMPTDGSLEGAMTNLRSALS